MSDDFTYDLPRRRFTADWGTGYTAALIVTAAFFCVSFVLYSHGYVPPDVSAILALVFSFGAIAAACVMILGGGGMVALPFFLIGASIFFGAGTYFSVNVVRSSLFFTEGQQWQMLPQVNLVNATAILCVLLAAGLICARRPMTEGKGEVMPLSDRLQQIRGFLPAAQVLGMFIVILEWLTFPSVQNHVVASILGVFEGAGVFAIFLGCAVWAHSNRVERAVTVLLFVLLVSEGLLSARKMSMIMPFFAAALGLWISERHRLVALGIATLTIWMYVAIISVYNPHIRGHVMYDPFNNTVSDRVSIVYDVVTTLEALQLDETTNSTLARFSPTQFSSHFIASYDNNFPGDSLDHAFIVLVPRIIWPDKPIINPGKQFDAAWRDVDIFSSLAIGFPAEAYWNDGWAGVVAVSVYIGLMLGWFSRKWFLFRRDGWVHGGVFVMSPLLVKSAIWVESNIVGAYVGGWMKYAMAILAFDFTVRAILYLRRRLQEELDDPLPVDMTPRAV